MNNWKQLFKTLSVSERQHCIAAWDAWCHAGDATRAKSWQDALANLAKCLRMRVSFVGRLPLDKRIQLMAQYAALLIKEHDDWKNIFRQFYSHHRTPLMVAMLDAANIPHNGQGEILEKLSESPDKNTWQAAFSEVLAQGFSGDLLSHYIHTLNGMDDSPASVFYHVLSAWQDYTPQSIIPVAALTSEDSPPAALLQQYGPDDFTTLDEVLHQHIIVTASEGVDALSPDKLEDFLNEVCHLSTQRAHNYFHLGFADRLVWQRKPDWTQHSGINAIRKAWYICGCLVACVRETADDDFRDLYQRFSSDLDAYIGTSSFIGTVMANHLFDYMAAHDYHHEALLMLKAMLQANHVVFIDKGLAAGQSLWRLAGPDIAIDYLTPVLQVLEQEGASYPTSLLFRAKRCYGQLLQGLGRFSKALVYFESLCVMDDGRNCAGLYADIALVKAGYRSLQEVRLWPSEDRRRATRKAILKGEKALKAAVALCDDVANANYLLAVLCYLNFHKKNNDGSRTQAKNYARKAVVAMLRSSSRQFYETMGLLSVARFIEVSMLTSDLDAADLPNLRNKWEEIHETTPLPPQDIAFFLEAVSLIEGSVAANIAADIWQSHGHNAWSIYKQSGVLVHILRFPQQHVLQGLQAILHDDNQEYGVRYSMAKRILGNMPETEHVALSSIGLDALDVMEHLAWSEPALHQPFRTFLDNKAYTPFWTEEDGLWASIHLARTMGDDNHCAALMPQLFYMYRDQNTNAAQQIVAQCKEWRLNPILVAQLEDAMPNIDVVHAANFRDQTPIRIVFVGGNEIQRRYDENIREWLSTRLPHVHVVFEHTGWTSNWSRELDTLLAHIEAADVVVLMRMMRTTLGRHLRKKVNKPWVPCTGSGRGAICLSIEEAARVIAEQRC